MAVSPAIPIYINITSKVPVQSLVKQIRTETQRLMKLNDENKPHFILEPHLTIARRLLPWQYEKGWLEYSHRHFTGRFIADAMLLLKRPVGELKYEIAQRFEFQNLPVGTKQGDCLYCKNIHVETQEPRKKENNVFNLRISAISA
jgi:hypothetical protein